MWEEVSCKYLKVRNVYREIFEGAHYRGQTQLVLIFRFSSFMYLILMFIFAAIFDKNKPVYMTSWNYLIVMIYFGVASLISGLLIHWQRIMSHQTGARRNTEALDLVVNVDYYAFPDVSSLTALDKACTAAYYVLSNTALTLSSLTTLIYWTVLADFSQMPKWSLYNFFLIDRHGLFFILVAIDFLLVDYPVHVMAFVYPDVVMIIYLVFHSIYYVVTKQAVYTQLDYTEHTLVAILATVLGPLLLIPFTHITWFFLYKLKEKLPCC